MVVSVTRALMRRPTNMTAESKHAPGNPDELLQTLRYGIEPFLEGQPEAKFFPSGCASLKPDFVGPTITLELGNAGTLRPFSGQAA